MLGISAVLACLYLFLLRCFAKPLLYISFILILIIFVVAGIYVFYSSTKYAAGDRTQKIMKGMAIILWGIAGIYLIILFCCCSRIRLGIAIMEATSTFVR
jgi:heme/copper-type cytochrome/quinol oxidase subunit 2